MLTGIGKHTGARLFIPRSLLALGLCLWLGVSTLTAVSSKAFAQELHISEGEAYTYLHDCATRNNMCDANWFKNQLLDSATVQFRYSGGQVDVLKAAEFVQHMRKRCRPYRIEYDEVSFRITTSGSRATGRWKALWSAEAGVGESEDSAIAFSTQVNLVRTGWDIRISGMDFRMRELVEGAEETYWARTGQADMLLQAERAYEGLFGRMRAWWEERNKKQ